MFLDEIVRARENAERRAVEQHEVREVPHHYFPHAAREDGTTAQLLPRLVKPEPLPRGTPPPLLAVVCRRLGKPHRRARYVMWSLLPCSPQVCSRLAKNGGAKRGAELHFMNDASTMEL